MPGIRRVETEPDAASFHFSSAPRRYLSGLYISWQLLLFDRPGHAEEYAQQLNRINGFRHTTSDRQSMPFRGTFWNRIGFSLNLTGMINDSSGSAFDRSTFRFSFDNAHLPYWFLLLLFAPGALPLIHRLRARHRRARRLRLNQCLSCGYDLRASADRCPECGTPAPAPQSG